MNNPEFFRENQYVKVENLVPIDTCRIVTKYALLKEQTEFAREGQNAQVPESHSVYSDTLMETLLHFLQKHMEKHTGFSLCPTYSYYRVYRPGMDLKQHVDRPSCEISTTVCFGFNYAYKREDYRWGMYVYPNNLITQNPGDAIIYKGTDLPHWRNVFEAGIGSYQVQGFFHYIDVNGPYYPEYAFDQRPGLGFRHINDK